MPYRVAITDGWFTDRDGFYERSAIREDCGHNHKTEEAAEKCRRKLMGWSKDGKTCSAHWYNAKVLPTDKEGRHVPMEEDHA